jgi:hypothetical protein
MSVLVNGSPTEDFKVGKEAFDKVVLFSYSYSLLLSKV